MRTEEFRYHMPAFRVDGTLLMSSAAFKDHCSLFPVSKTVVEDNADELVPYVSGKGTLRFRPDAPIPAELVTKMVGARLAEIEARRYR